MLKCVLCLCIISTVFGSFIITEPSNLVAGSPYPSLGYVLEGLQGDWKLNGTLVLADPTTPCGNLKNADALKGNIAVTVIGTKTLTPTTSPKLFKQEPQLIILV